MESEAITTVNWDVNVLKGSVDSVDSQSGFSVQAAPLVANYGNEKTAGMTSLLHLAVLIDGCYKQ